jgi:hypothetical protein
MRKKRRQNSKDTVLVKALSAIVVEHVATEEIAEPYSAIADNKVSWVTPGLIPEGCLTLLVGNPGTAKSLLTHTWAGELSQQGLNTLLLSAEDAPSSVIGPRLTACNADKSRIFTPGKPISLPSNIHYLEQIVIKHRPRLIVLDLLDSFSALSLSHGGNTHRVLGGLIGLARKYALGILGVLHVGKTKKADMHRTLGSVELGGMARSVMVLEEAKEGKRLRHIKCNIAPLHEPIHFRIESVHVGDFEAPIMVYQAKGKEVPQASPGQELYVLFKDPII